MRGHILVVFRELWSSDILRLSDKIYMSLSVGEPGVGIFLIRKVTRLRNWWLQFLKRFLMVFHHALEFSDCLLVLRIFEELFFLIPIRCLGNCWKDS